MNKVPTIRKVELAKSKYNIKCPRYRNPKGIVVHNTYNDAPAANEVAYMQRRTDKVSFHAAIDDKEVVEGLPFERSCYASGDGENGDGNRNYLQFEICYSLSGGDKYKQAEENAVWYIAHVMNDYNFPMNELKKHQDFSGKYCPHRILEEKRWESFVDRVRWCREQLKNEKVVDESTSVESVVKSNGETWYQVVVGSYLGKNKANEVKAKLESQGYTGVWIDVTTKDNQTYYRVICGSYQDRANADKIKAKLDKFYTGVWINVK
ncbi:N-acetylmuramoyl-L-alanine amidase [Turicibacter sanguinis]|uniref:N-acetylmuramoyl-L-alanine amidase n=1 Tax=Turicibacter sanguinis TaxID=154288 RepID=A0A9X5AQH6_9FIRM|nr:N-acetylmuramoyl-L-alanine amidase [Turicibacter sanguinis]KAB6697496.1 N-acetylmuramoyl-L-alanine amidase [Phocaeicola vulgatus]MCU7192476.1 SPOR domain-containing protein [Turicibacter sanguinis]MTK22710.1 N-acetylmuramoyl-L-alanine amidase [Turicibacter sanguinis]